MRPLPELTPENTAFWTGGAAGKLMIAFCADCHHAIHPPQLICPKCWSEAVEEKPVPGTGIVYSYTVNHQPWAPGMQVPFALAVVGCEFHILSCHLNLLQSSVSGFVFGGRGRGV